MKLVEIKDLHKTYKIGEVEVKALQGVSFSIEEGDFLAIMGASGSGKSTLMHLLGLLDTADKGSIRLAGKDITRLDEKQHAYLRNKVIGFVFQQFNLMGRSTAVENVMLPLLYSEDGKNDQVERSKKLLAQVGLADRFHHRPNELSGGQQQRVAIARALVNHPFLILADEPTGNLDSKSGREVMDILKGLHAQGLTVGLVTHDEKVAEAASRIVRMQDGKIIEDIRTKPFQASGQKVTSAKVEIPEMKKYSPAEFREHYHQAFRMIASNKLRSFLSMLGVLIGVACVITMLALGRGAREAITEQLARLGSNLLSVRPGSAKVRGVALEAGAVTRFTLEDAKVIQEAVPFVKRVAPQVSGSVQLVYGDKNWST
ncbi:MAG TPA: ATP-binding cassette domain-containing protein, partial [bacterium]|nr:ATP-binding cassette domain-containing protein [bacterium]